MSVGEEEVRGWEPRLEGRPGEESGSHPGALGSHWRALCGDRVRTASRKKALSTRQGGSGLSLEEGGQGTLWRGDRPVDKAPSYP